MKKTKKFTDESTGRGTVKRPTNPADLFRKGKKNKKKVVTQVIAHKKKGGKK